MIAIILVTLLLLIAIIIAGKNIIEVYQVLKDKNILIKGTKAFFMGMIATIIDGI